MVISYGTNKDKERRKYSMAACEGTQNASSGSREEERGVGRCHTRPESSVAGKEGNRSCSACRHRTENCSRRGVTGHLDGSASRLSQSHSSRSRFSPGDQQRYQQEQDDKTRHI